MAVIDAHAHIYPNKIASRAVDAVGDFYLIDMFGERLRHYFPANSVDHPGIWMSHVFDQVRFAIVRGDRLAMSIACDLIDKDPHMPFGKLIKSGLARALKQNAAALSPAERLRLVHTTLRLLALPYAPRELEDYAKLLRKLPCHEYLPLVDAVKPQNAKASRLRVSLLAIHA